MVLTVWCEARLRREGCGLRSSVRALRAMETLQRVWGWRRRGPGPGGDAHFLTTTLATGGRVNWRRQERIAQVGEEAGRGWRLGLQCWSAGGATRTKEKDAWEVKLAGVSRGFHLKSDRGEGKCQYCFLSG